MSIELPPNYKIEEGQLFEVKKSGRQIPKSILALQSQLGEQWPAFVEHYLTTWPLKIRIATGEDIHEVFENHRPGSCMRYTSKRELREVYANNPDDVCAAYITRDDNPILCSDASCLVWIGKNNIYVDRIYASGWPTPNCLNFFIRGIGQLFPDRNLVSIYHDTAEFPRSSKSIKFTLVHNSDDPLPYMDTINTIVDYSGTRVTLSNHGHGPCCSSQEGTYPSGAGRYSCCDCNCSLHEDEMHVTDWGDAYCEECYYERYTYISVRVNGRWIEGTYSVDDVVRIDDEWYPKDECHELHNGDWAVSGDCVELHNGDYALLDEAVELYWGEYALVDDCTQLHNGDWALSDDDDIVELHNGDWAVKDECTQLHNGDWALSDDDDIVELHNGDWAYRHEAVELDDTIYNPDAYALLSQCEESENGYVLVSDRIFCLVG